jgi:drug/metabolite transporter (DMT)-like permease
MCEPALTPPSKTSDPAAMAMLFVIGVAFALTFVFNRLAITHGVPLIPYVGWQAFGGALILLIVCAVKGELPQISAQSLRLYFITGLFNICIPVLILSLVAPKVPSGILSLGLMLIPLMIYGLALALGMDQFRWVRLIGILAGLAGVLFVVLPQASLPSREMAGWVLLALVAPLCYAFGAILMAWLQMPVPKSLLLACGLLSASAVMVVVVMTVTGSWWFFEGNFGTGHWAVIGAMANQAAIFVLMFEIIQRAGPVFFSTSNYIATLLGVVLGMLFFGDSYSWWIWGAMVLMFIGLFCVNVIGAYKPRAIAVAKT